MDRFLCKDCGRTFGVPVPGIMPHCRIDNEVKIQAVSIQMGSSASEAQRALKQIGATISHDTVLRAMDLVEEEMPSAVELSFIGVDDVSKKRGQVYCTVCYSGFNHGFMCLLDGRDGSELGKWLEGKGVKPTIATRDRGTGMSSAVTSNSSYTIQGADLWHLFKNNSDHIRDDLARMFKDHLFFKDGALTDETFRKEPAPKVSVDAPELEALNTYDNSVPKDPEGKDIAVSIVDNLGTDPHKRAQEKNRAEKKEKVIALRREYGEGGKSKAQLARDYGLSVGSVNKYLNMPDEQVASLDQKTPYATRESVVDGYRNSIYKMLEAGVDPGEILAWCIKNGYGGSPSTLSNNIRSISFNHFGNVLPRNVGLVDRYPAGVEAVSRFELQQYMMSRNKTDKKDETIAKYYDDVTKKYPMVRELESAWHDFYWTMKGSDPAWLDVFIQKYEKGPLNRFVSGLKMDKEAVANAIRYKIDNGYREGLNNLLKLVKRLMFGRASTKLLGKRLYLICAVRHKAKTLRELVKFT